MTSPLNADVVQAAAQYHLPGHEIIHIEALGTWIRHNYRLMLDNGEVAYLKADADLPASEKEAWVCEFLRQHDLPAPRILALDASCERLPTAFLIQAHVGGTRLSTLLDSVGDQERRDIYTSLGAFYRKLHAIHYEHAGWIQGAGEVLPFSPNRHQYNEVIIKLGARAVAQGHLSAANHGRLQILWKANLDYLDAHVPSLVGSSLPWAIYLSPEGGWHVTKLMDMHDMLYWDAAWDLTAIRYPPFREPLRDDLWQAFLSTYGPEPDAKRMALYRLMQYLDAALGNFMQPDMPGNDAWIAWVWQMYPALLDDLGSL